MVLWQLPAGKSEMFYFAYFLVASIFFYMAYTVFATPWVALGYELTPDYHERTRLMGVQNFIGQIPYMISPWFLWIMNSGRFFPDQVSGAAGLAVDLRVRTRELPFRDIEIQKRENDLVGATFGRGMYILDDYSPLRHVSEASLTPRRWNVSIMSRSLPMGSMPSKASSSMESIRV